MRKRGLLLLVSFLLLLSSAAWGAVDTVRLVDFAFVPANLTITAGDTVVWKVTMECCLPHTTTRSSGPLTWDSGPLPLNNTFKVGFPTVGTFNYVCTSHEFSGMTGSISVSAPKIPVLGILGLALLLASMAAAGIWMLKRRRQAA